MAELAEFIPEYKQRDDFKSKISGMMCGEPMLCSAAFSTVPTQSQMKQTHIVGRLK